MAVTELALLRLTAGPDALLSPALLAHFYKAKVVMEHASGFDFHFYHCVEDPGLVYIIGAWPSVEFHMDEFIPSPENQELLALVKDQVSVEWMFHVDIDQRERRLPLQKGTLSIARYFLRSGAMDHLIDRSKLQEYIADSEVVGGCRLDLDESRDEIVLFSGGDSVEIHNAVVGADPFRQHSRIQDHVERAEIQHAVRLSFGND